MSAARDTFVSLAEFQQLTGLSDRALISLLSQNELRCEIDPKEGIVIDVASAHVESLVSAIVTRQQDLLPHRRKVLIERFARIIGEEFEEMIEDALSIIAADRASGST